MILKPEPDLVIPQINQLDFLRQFFSNPPVSNIQLLLGFYGIDFNQLIFPKRIKQRGKHEFFLIIFLKDNIAL